MARRVKVNMEGVESFTRCPEGTWLARLKKIDMVEIQGSGDDGLKAQFEVIKGSAKGNSVFETFSLAEKALWKLKQCLEAMGLKASGKLTLDLDKIEGKICLIDVIHDEYNGQKRAKISAYMKPGDESDEDVDDEDIDDTEDEEDEEEEAPKKGKKVAKTHAKKSKKPEPEDDEEDDEDEDEDEEEEKPKKGKKTASKPAKKAPAKPKKKTKDEDEDEDDEDDWEEDDD